jgi:predicted RNA-binding protein with RPS1 domain
MTTVKEKTPSEIVDKAVNEVIMEEENNGFKRGELKPFLEKMCEKYDIPFTTIRNRYYRDVKANAKPNRKALAVKQTTPKETKSKKATVKDEIIITHNQTENEIQSEVQAGSSFNLPTPAIQEQSPMIKKLNPVDEDIKRFNEKPVDRIFTSAKDHYRLNQLVDVKIANIQSYGAFCEILDGRGFNALCHISEMVDGFIKDVNDYLEVGQIIQKTKICLVESKKINVSMKHLNLKKRAVPIVTSNGSVESPTNPPINNIGDKFGNLKDKLLQRVTETTYNNALKNDQKEIDEIFSLEELSPSQEQMLKKYEKDIFQMTSYLQEELGVLSKSAKLELANILEDFGIFNVTRGILKTQNDFKADIGLLFMQQMKNKMGEYL